MTPADRATARRRSLDAPEGVPALPCPTCQWLDALEDKQHTEPWAGQELDRLVPLWRERHRPECTGGGR